MRIECKKCKRNLTAEAIKMLEGKIDKVVCICEDEELRNKIAEEFGLYDTRKEYLTNRGHNLSNCEWMVHETAQVITAEDYREVVINNK